MKKFPSLPPVIPFVYRLRWTGIRFKTWRTVWCCCYLFSFWLSWKFALMPAVHLEEPDCSSFYSNPSSFKSASPCVPLGSDVEIPPVEHLWNYLKCLYNVLLNFGYRSNTTTTDSFISVAAVLEASGWHILVYMPLLVQLFLRLANHKWWAPLQPLIWVLIGGRQITSVISNRACTVLTVWECQRILDHIFNLASCE